MKICILGTRGIPNNYGGFEQFAEFLSRGLTELGHDVFVYSPHDHPFAENKWNGVNIIHKLDPEKWIGTAGQFVYDLLCILDSRHRRFDVVLQLGYTSSSIWNFLIDKSSVLVTNMDGLEWKRSKYSSIVRRFLHFAEGLAVRRSHILISDSIGIQQYLMERYNAPSYYIPYGAHIYECSAFDFLTKYGIKKFNYSMLVARLEPENNIETILDGVVSSSCLLSFLVIGNHMTKYGTYLKLKYRKDSRISFMGGIYNIDELNSLRYFSKYYFHGHSVGGTNPSLLEAMSSSALICAHDNVFNKSILTEDAIYFSTSSDVAKVLDQDDFSMRNDFIQRNILKIQDQFGWSLILSKYEEVMKQKANIQEIKI